MGDKQCFRVKGKPFFSIGFQAHNSMSSTPGLLEYTWNAARLLEVNTVAVPVPWEIFERTEGSYDRDFVVRIIDEARKNHLHLVLLWFGTWKNGTMEYTPGWVKKDWKRFARAELKDGTKTHNLSPFCQENLLADQRAFCQLIRTIREYDQQENTVIAVQIENEAGILSGTRRDFSQWGNQAFDSQVPERLMKYIKENPQCRLAAKWKKCGEKPGGTWREVFGGAGAEYVTAWGVASYIDRIAAAAKEIYDIFLYTNAWLSSERGIAGIDWPAGTSLPRNLDIYYAAGTHLDAIAPDIYLPETTQYLETLKTYAHPEKGFPLYVPESARTVFNSGMLMEGIGSYGAIGYHVFGGESLLTDDQTDLTEEGKSMMHTFHMLRNISGILPDYLGSERIHTIHQRGEEQSDLIEELDGGWSAYVSFKGTTDAYYRMDFCHKEACREEITGNKGEPCRGLLLQESENVFYVVGHKFRIFFKREEVEDGALNAIDISPVTFPTNAEYLSVAEGCFDQDGKFHATRIRTGDEARHGTFAQWDTGVLRIELLPVI